MQPERHPRADSAAPERISLRAGPLSMVFEPGTTFLRYLRLGRREVLRGIYAAVRDRRWNTITSEITDLQWKQERDAFRLTFDASAQGGEVDFAWRGTVTGARDGTVRFEMDGRARSRFLRNRIGFCVLHPAGCAGRPCTVEHVDGTVEEGRFPRDIAPHQPFQEMRAVTHEAVPGLRAEVRFEGDVFEMEDQRNWTDASFKTYGTPLALPFPVEVAEGTRIRQAVTLRLHGTPPTDRAATTEEEVVEVRVEAGPPLPLPQIGLVVAHHGEPLSPREVERLRALRPAHLRVDLRLDEPGFRERLARAWSEAQALGAALEAALFVTDRAEAELTRLRAALEEIRPRLGRWLVFHKAEPSTTAPWIHCARRALTDYSPDVPLGGGTNLYFTELNRERPPAEVLDVVCYSINPQVHAFDDASLVETLPMQRETLANVRRFAPGVPVAVTPVTLRPRFNPHGMDAAQPEHAGLPFAIDARQPTCFGAAWTLGSLKYLTEGGAHSVTFYETTGPRGVMETEHGTPYPAFPSEPGSVYPLYHVLADVASFAGGGVRRTVSSDPLRTAALALTEGGRTACVLVANLSPEPQRVHLHHPAPGATVRIRTLDETTSEEAATGPEAFRASPGDLCNTENNRIELDLRPHAYMRLDFGV